MQAAPPHSAICDRLTERALWQTMLRMPSLRPERQRDISDPHNIFPVRLSMSFQTMVQSYTIRRYAVRLRAGDSETALYSILTASLAKNLVDIVLCRSIPGWMGAIERNVW